MCVLLFFSVENVVVIHCRFKARKLFAFVYENRIKENVNVYVRSFEIYYIRHNAEFFLTKSKKKKRKNFNPFAFCLDVSRFFHFLAIFLIEVLFYTDPNGERWIKGRRASNLKYKGYTYVEIFSSYVNVTRIYSFQNN